MKLSEYQEIHSQRSTFLVRPDHQVDSIEEIIKKTPTYSVVIKNNTTAEPSDILNDTEVDNS